MGSKSKLSKYIIPIILKNRQLNQFYVDPFCGGCNSLDKVSNPRIGNDSNKYLISFLKYLQLNIPFNPPPISEELYKQIQYNKQNYPDYLVGYVGFNLSFAAKFFAGYRRDKYHIRDYQKEAIKNIQKQQKSLINIDFYNLDYKSLHIPSNSIIYCDPPYNNSTKYKDPFNHMEFYDWCRQKYKQNHQIFISEYSMPSDFVCIFQKEQSSNLDVSKKGRRKIEKLFTLNT